MRISLNSQVEISISSTETVSQLKKRLKDIMEVAAIKALEVAVERTPAAGETPYSTGQLRQSIRVQIIENDECIGIFPFFEIKFLSLKFLFRRLKDGVQDI